MASCSLRSSNVSPVAATVSRIARLTAGSRARSAGSSKKLTSENVSDDDVVEKAGGGLARVRRVSVEALALRLCARVSTPSVGLEDIAEGVVCATLCVEASEKALGDQKEPPFVTSSFFTLRGHSN
jgi:endoglucanase Acf2